jgi:hypothetical protein
MKPRIYIIWVVLLVWNMIRVVKLVLKSIWDYNNNEKFRSEWDQYGYTLINFIVGEISTNSGREAYKI